MTVICLLSLFYVKFQQTFCLKSLIDHFVLRNFVGGPIILGLCFCCGKNMSGLSGRTLDFNLLAI